MDRECLNWGVDQVVDELFDTDNELPVSYYQWCTPVDGRVKKLLVVSNVVGAKGDLKTFGRYVYNVRRQFQELRHLKDCLPTGEVIIHENFPENFQLKHQNEIMAAYWSNASVTIFTAVAYFRETKEGAIEHASFAVNSDEMSHDKSTIYKLTILPSIVLKKVTIMKVHYQSDGPSSQLKNRYDLASLLFRHACDSVSAEVKQAGW